ncbi:hypothetical protein PYW08_004812 [Mythimna loreyi]|uniref:Uncharacterized protein n=1 Tax=Mythimna loreyi TaxID=667449 RepID=A0ACC2QF89_9NEOP|nr:hypothetical protein PYW08_004812 [Mythimna loreyi]
MYKLKFYYLLKMRMQKMSRSRRKTKRAPRIKTIIRPGCIICHEDQCIDERLPAVACKVNPAVYDGRITRSLSKLLDSLKHFIIIEAYRCMPLLGDEQENVPNWDVHIVRYSIVFIDHNTTIN